MPDRWFIGAPIGSTLTGALTLVVVTTSCGFGANIGTGTADHKFRTDDPLICDTEELYVPSAELRRLDRFSYFATLQSLFPNLDLSGFNIPRDPADHGFENRADLLNPSALLIEEYSKTAAEIAVLAMQNPNSVLPCIPASTAEEPACAAQFVAELGARVFRRPLTSEEQQAYEGFLNNERGGTNGWTGAVQLTLEALLQDPEFLYRFESGEPDQDLPGVARLTSLELATRMAAIIWGTGPDDALRNAAASDELQNSEVRRIHARRMLADRRAEAMIVDFHRQWLDLDQLFNEPKDPGTYPMFSPSLAAAMRAESDRFVSRIMWQGDGTLDSFFTDTTTEVNAELAAIYGVQPPASGWEEVNLDRNERAGWLTQANFLASRSHQVVGSPPLRAIFIFEKFLCQPSPTPPADADLSEPRPTPGTGPKTNRQLFEERLQTSASCQGCHDTFEGLGYAFEHFDAVGRHRSSDNGLPIDPTGTFRLSRDDVDWDISGARDLSQTLGDSEAVRACVVKQWFEFAVGRKMQAEDRCWVKSLEDAVVAGNGDIREALVELVASSEFAVRPEVVP